MEAVAAGMVADVGVVANSEVATEEAWVAEVVTPESMVGERSPRSRRVLRFGGRIQFPSRLTF